MYSRLCRKQKKTAQSGERLSLFPASLECPTRRATLVEHYVARPPVCDQTVVVLLLMNNVHNNVCIMLQSSCVSETEAPLYLSTLVSRGSTSDRRCYDRESDNGTAHLDQPIV